MPAFAEVRRATGATFCLECGKCSTLCPLAGGAFSASRVAAIQDPEAEVARQASAVDRCLTCAACEVRCPQGVRFSELVLALRGLVGPAARRPCPHGALFQSAARWQAAAGGAARRDLGWLAGDGLRLAEQGRVGLFVGCLPLFDLALGDELGIDTRAVARAAVRLLNAAGIEPVVVEGEVCCGHDLLWDGDRATFARLAESNARAFQERGVERIVTACAECCRTWRLDYPEAVPGYRPRVEHLAETLAAELAAGRVTFAAAPAGAVTFQDPCRLGRHLHQTAAPRALLAALPELELVEMAEHGADARCCGTPGFIRCDAESRRLQGERLRAARGSGAQRLLTACPKCLIHLTCAQTDERRRAGREPDLEIVDLAVFAARALAAEPGRTGPLGAAGQGAES